MNLRCLGLLWCDGDKEEKTVELYNALQPSGKSNEITCNDLEFKPYIRELFNIATVKTFKFEQIYMKTGPCEFPEDYIKGVIELMFD